MTSLRTYLDWNATAPLRPQARAAMLDALDATGNPSSVHFEGRRARRVVEDARQAVAALVGADSSEIVFTSGATEANATLLSGPWATVFCSGIEHQSVTEPLRRSGAQIVALPVSVDGVVELSAFSDAVKELKSPARQCLAVLQMANNETGVIQPVAELATIAREHGLAVHTDAVQAVGRLPVDQAALGVSSLAISAHKIGGPRGVGALVVRDGSPFKALIAGGGQERGRRAGTENVVGIAGFGAAAIAAAAELSRIGEIAELRDEMETALLAITPDARIIGAGVARIANTTCVALPERSSESLVAGLDLAGIAVSAGAACSSGKVSGSAVLAAMGVPEPLARSAVRLSIGLATTRDDIQAFLAAWSALSRRMARAA